MAGMVSPFLAQCVSPCGGGGGFHLLSLGFVCLSGPGLRLFRSPGLQWGLWFCPPPHAVLCESKDLDAFFLFAGCLAFPTSLCTRLCIHAAYVGVLGIGS